MGIGRKMPRFDTIERISAVLGMKPCFNFALSRKENHAEIRLNHAISTLSADSKDKLSIFLESISKVF